MIHLDAEELYISSVLLRQTYILVCYVEIDKSIFLNTYIAVSPFSCILELGGKCDVIHFSSYITDLNRRSNDSRKDVVEKSQ